MENNKIAVIILFYNKLEQTSTCIKSFLPSNQNIYVLNNASEERQWTELQRKFRRYHQVHFFNSEKNLGVSGGRNFLISNTKENWIFSVDNDIKIKKPEKWLNKFENHINETPEIEIFCPKLFNVHEKAYSEPLFISIKDNQFELSNKALNICNYFPGGASIVKREVFELHGLYDEAMFIGFEDYEYAIRAMLLNKRELKVLHINDIELIHNHKYQKTSFDKNAVNERYNKETLKRSFERIEKKYNISFVHNWEWWSENQLINMTKMNFLRRQIRKIQRLFYR